MKIHKIMNDNFKIGKDENGDEQIASGNGYCISKCGSCSGKLGQVKVLSSI